MRILARWRKRLNRRLKKEGKFAKENPKESLKLWMRKDCIND